jgi:hypothetical protein
MATAFYGTMTIQNTDGTIQADKFDSTDVTLAYVTFASTGGLAFIYVQKDGYIKDVVLNITSAGTTKDFKLWIDQKDTNIRWVQSACFPNINTHFPNMNPIPVRAGQMIQIQAI